MDVSGHGQNNLLRGRLFVDWRVVHLLTSSALDEHAWLPEAIPKRLNVHGYRNIKVSIQVTSSSACSLTRIIGSLSRVNDLIGGLRHLSRDNIILCHIVGSNLHAGHKRLGRRRPTGLNEHRLHRIG